MISDVTVTVTQSYCYNLNSMLSKKYTFILSNIRKLNRKLHTETSILYTKL